MSTFSLTAVPSATYPNALAERSAAYQPTLPSVEAEGPIAPTEPLDVEGVASRLMTLDLTFPGQRSDHATHSLHSFPAKFPAQLPALFIEQLTRPGERVLDPMVGSGTTTVEALLAGREAIGIDLDPLAAMIAYAKSNPVSPARCAQLGRDVLRFVEGPSLNAEATEIARCYSPEALRFFDYWFEPETIAELHALSRAISQVGDPEVRIFLQVVLSSSIITKTGALTRARDLGHSRPHRDHQTRVRRSAIRTFEERLSEGIRKIVSIQNVPNRATIAVGDARALPLPANSVHLVVTSPPYASNAIDYMRVHKFSLMWLGHDPMVLRGLRARFIGTERALREVSLASDAANMALQALSRVDERRSFVVARYFADLAATLAEIYRVLVPGRAAILVLGSSTIKGVHIPAARVAAELGQAAGFRLIGMALRDILRDFRMMPVSSNSARSGIEARLHEEGVIGLIKPV